MVGWIVRILILLLIVRLVWRFLAAVLAGSRRERQAALPGRGVPLVRDPVCGTFVVPSRALAAKSGDTVHYFCSERCRHAYSRAR